MSDYWRGAFFTLLFCAGWRIGTALRERFSTYTLKVDDRGTFLAMFAGPLLLQALEMVRDADDEARREGSPTIPAHARVYIDECIAKAYGQ